MDVPVPQVESAQVDTVLIPQESEGQTPEIQSTILTADGGDQVDLTAIVPETASAYSFEFDKGSVIDDAMLGLFKDSAHEHGLTQKQAQAMASFYEKTMSKGMAHAQEQIVKQEKDWVDECKNDPTIGGAKFDQSVVKATLAMQRFGTKELNTILEESGYGSHPDIVRFMVRVGQAIQEKPMVSGAHASPKSAAELFYPSMSNK